MPRYASGKKAYFISDRSGLRFPYKEMRKEWNGSMVAAEEFEPKHPQLGPFRRVSDAQALKNARPDNDKGIVPFVVYTNFDLGIIGQKLETFEVTASVGTVTVSVS